MHVAGGVQRPAVVRMFFLDALFVGEAIRRFSSAAVEWHWSTSLEVSQRLSTTGCVEIGGGGVYVNILFFVVMCCFVQICLETDQSSSTISVSRCEFYVSYLSIQVEESSSPWIFPSIILSNLKELYVCLILNVLIVLPLVGTMHKMNDHLYLVLDLFQHKFILCLRCYSLVLMSIFPLF